MKKNIRLNSLKLFSLLTLISLSFQSNAHDHQNQHASPHLDDSSVRFFTSYESNGSSYIQGIGTGFRFTDENTDLGFELSTSFNHAEVTTTDGYLENYLAWEGSVKLGLFSNVSVYFEAGIDLTELFFYDERYDDHNGYYYDDDQYHDNIDAFIGIGGGFQAGPIKIEAFSRLREIDSLYWEAEAEVFNGVQFSINF